MPPRILAGGVAVLFASGLAAAQPASVPAPTPGVPAEAAGSPPAQAPPNAAPAESDAPPPPSADGAAPVLGNERPVPGAALPPPREAPRAHVSIVTPQESTVHKRRRGIRAQDGDGVVDGAAQDAPAGPTVERLE